MSKIINLGVPITPEDAWMLLKRGDADTVILNGVEFRKDCIESIDDIYMELYGLTRAEWFDYISEILQSMENKKE